jgi:WXG100 family type VII secretion target
MYRVDLAALAASAAHVAGLGEDVATAHLASDNRIAGAQSGWVGASAVALNITAAEWLQASRRLLGRLGDHAMALTNDGMRFAAAEHASAEKLRALGQV